MTESAFVDAVLAAGRANAARAALIDLQGAVITYRQLGRHIAASRRWFANGGVHAGDRVFIHLPNSIDWPIAVLGAMALGAQVAVCPASMTDLEINQRVRLVRPRLVVTTSPQLSRMHTLVAGQVSVHAFNRVALPVTAAEETGARRSSRPPDRSAAALIQFSSGTTGPAKAVVLSNANLLQAAAVIGDHFGLGPADRTYTLAPYAHAMGAVVTVATALLAGATVVTDPEPDPRALPDRIREFGLTHLVVPPPVLRLLLAAKPTGQRASSLRLIASGGSPVPADLQAAVTDKLGCRIVQGYGMTETTAVIALSRGIHDAGTCGPPCAGFETRLLDPEHGTPITGETGELAVRSPTVMLGYLDDPQATAACLDANGWLRTGDLVQLSGGVVRLIGRAKELIKVNAYQVAPAELEELLCRHPKVADAAVIGRPDPRTGEAPVAFVVAPANPEPTELIDWLTPQLSPYKRLAELRLVTAIPRTPAGKVDRHALRRWLSPASDDQVDLHQ